MSYEENVRKMKETGEPIPGKLDISVLKYFWQRSPLSGRQTRKAPNFLRGLEVLKNFTDNELRIFSKLLHMRTFNAGEVVFKQDDIGFGFYFIFSGHLTIVVRRIDEVEDRRLDEVVSSEKLLVNDDLGGEKLVTVASLEKGDYFGELALLQGHSVRSASAIAKNSCVLYGMFKPDVEELINYHPVIGAKLLQSISLIVANRHTSITNEIQALKYKLYQLETNAKE